MAELRHEDQQQHQHQHHRQHQYNHHHHHHPHNQLQQQQQQQQPIQQQQQQQSPRQAQQQQQHEFLPLCDVLFNIISLASYFCDIVFDVAMAYALSQHPETPRLLFPLSFVLILGSLVVSQVVSVRWYLWGPRGKLRAVMEEVEEEEEEGPGKPRGRLKRSNPSKSWKLGCVLLLHATQMGVLWRYFKLFVPVELAYVKHEVRELCVLRLIHAFCEAAPMLLLQVHLLLGARLSGAGEGGGGSGSLEEDERLAELALVSAGLSLWSVCWAVASFSKAAARLRNIERLVLTWLGVLAQLAWRLCTVSARVGALVAYAAVYGSSWLLVVLLLHWLSMLTWLLLTPDGLFRPDERLAPLRKLSLAAMLAFLYVFSYVNLHETNSRQKMVLIFYSVMFLENSLLVGVWAVGISRTEEMHRNARPTTLILTLLCLFFGGLCFMGLYYRFFHVRRLKYEAGGRMNGTNGITTLSQQDVFQEKQIINGLDDKQNNEIGMRKLKLSNGGIPGVFNCRFANPAVTNPNRKKKKPTTFVPPPTQPQVNVISLTTLAENNKWDAGNENGPQLIPFWKKPLPVPSVNNDNDTRRDKNESDMTVGSSLNVNLIHEKLREKKQQQLRELRAIQEEIKEGKLVPPPLASTSSTSASNQKPPPNTKLHTSAGLPDQGTGSALTSWPPVKMHCLLPPPPSSPYYPTSHPTANLRTAAWRQPVAAVKAPDNSEVLLAPRCLPPYHHPGWIPLSTNQRLCNGQHCLNERSKTAATGKEEGHVEDDFSDIEGSQLSLPRSYTLSREFGYLNKNNERRDSRFTGSRYYLPSTNSSDGDVDSADNEEETDSELQVRARPVPGVVQQLSQAQKNEPPEQQLNNSRNSHSVQAPLSFGMLRSNQLVRVKPKPETKL